MKVTEEVARRRLSLKIGDVDRAYAELRDLLNTRVDIDSAHEEKYYNDVEEGVVRAEIKCVEGFGQHSDAIYKIFLALDPSKGEMDIQMKSKLVTEYPDDKAWQDTLWYYAYRSIFEKFLYGTVREGYEHDVEEKTDAILRKARETLETR
jgi:hypothetical protein